MKRKLRSRWCKIERWSLFADSTLPENFDLYKHKDIEKSSMDDRSQILSRIWILKNFNRQKFLRLRLRQYTRLAEMLCRDIAVDAANGEHGVDGTSRGSEQSNNCVIWVFIIIPLDPFQVRNFHIYQGTRKTVYQQNINTLWITQKGCHIFELRGWLPGLRTHGVYHIRLWADFIWYRLCTKLGWYAIWQKFLKCCRYYHIRQGRLISSPPFCAQNMTKYRWTVRNIFLLVRIRAKYHHFCHFLVQRKGNFGLFYGEYVHDPSQQCWLQIFCVWKQRRANLRRLCIL